LGREWLRGTGRGWNQAVKKAIASGSPGLVAAGGASSLFNI